MKSNQRSRLVYFLNALPQPQFDQLHFTLEMPAGQIPGDAASPASRVAALLAWVESPIGPGLAELEATLIALGLLQPGQLKDREIPQQGFFDLGPNPYKGLKAFEEEDQDCFFGRDELIEELMQRFNSLHQTPQAVRNPNGAISTLI